MVSAAVKPSAPPSPPMNKPRTNPQREPGTAQRDGPGLLVRVLVSVVLVWHITAVFLAPLSIQPASELVVSVAQKRPMQWYLDLLYLNHGYHFFAPDPGPGHIIRYELLDERGEQIATGEFPNRKEHWPRLWYHRHFMLADQSSFPSGDASMREHWERRYLVNFAQQLLRSHEQAQTARVRRVAHWPLPRDLSLDGKKLNDPEGYQTMLEVTQHRSDIEPAPTQGAAWQQGRQQIGLRPGETSGWTGGVR